MTAFVREIRSRTNAGQGLSTPAAGDDLLDAYCLECDAIHEELDFLIYEMDLSVMRLHETSLEDCRIAILYHMDNFALRIFAYREKIFQLVNRALRLGVDARDPELRSKVLQFLAEPRLESVKGSLLTLENDPEVKRILRERNALVHRIAHRESETLKPRRRAEDSLNPPDPIDKIDRLTYIEHLHETAQEKFGLICRVLADFRRNLAEALRRAG